MERHADPVDASLELTMTETQSLINSRKNVKECAETGFCTFCSEPVDLGEQMEGDGVTTAQYCPNTEQVVTNEPDADPVYCTVNNADIMIENKTCLTVEQIFENAPGDAVLDTLFEHNLSYSGSKNAYLTMMSKVPLMFCVHAHAANSICVVYESLSKDFEGVDYSPAKDSDSYANWLQVGKSLHEKYKGSQEGLSTWKTMCAGSENYSNDDLNRLWDSFKSEDSVGDVNSKERGSGARFNEGKPDFSLIPLTMIAEISPLPHTLQEVIGCVGRFQMRTSQQLCEADELLNAVKLLAEYLPDCANVFDYGRKKYAAWNWAKGMAWSIPIACIGRHFYQIANHGEEIDSESGFSHIGHILCNIMMLIWYIDHYPEGDDRYEPAPVQD